MGRLFGTDGVRGVANIELTPELAFNLGRAAAYVLSFGKKPKFVVGMDTRISGGMLEAAIISGILSVGGDVVQVGVIPTPAVSYLTRRLQADSGVVISASHNPYEFNGIKFFNENGYKFSDELEERIEAIILDGSEAITSVIGSDIGSVDYYTNGSLEYIEFLKKSANPTIDGIKVAVDCANGATSKVIPRILRELGAHVYVINDTPNGININENCGSTHMTELQRCVLQNKCQIGLAFDGDGDRVLGVDENGLIVDGDKIMSIIACDLKKQGKFKNNTIVATVMSNLGLDVMAKRESINIVKTNVGDRNVLENMIENDYIIGGEQSGHIILLDYNTTGDGPLTALIVLDILSKSNMTMSSLAGIMDIYPQVLENAKVSNVNKYRYLEDELIKLKCKELEDEFCGEGRVLIRPSGTEPLVRVMIEGKNADYITKKAKEIARLIEMRLA